MANALDGAASKLKDVITVKDFGARGDGLADDREAICHAIDYAAAVGKLVYFPPGRYRLMPSPWWYRILKWLRRWLLP